MLYFKCDAEQGFRALAVGATMLIKRMNLLAEFDRIETRFTMHDLGSEAMRDSRGEMALDDASAEYREVLAQARD